MPTRRQLLWGITGALGAVSGVFAWRFVRSSDTEAIVMIIKKRLNYLILDDDNLRQFAKELSASNQVSAKKLRIVPMLGALYEYLPGSGNFIFDALRHGEERVVSSFLLSSDFFVNGADESRPVKYLGMYDPLRACGNPFARPVGAAT
jgi:hypothetical protein